MYFGTSGIRDLYGKKITPEFVMRLANAFADINEEIAIATDKRETREILKSAAISGVLAKGANIIDLGEVPTPTLACYTQIKNSKGIVITASHNPCEYNGLKFYRNGREISRQEEKTVERNYENGMVLAEWNKVGKCFAYPNAVYEHIELIKRNINVEKIKNAKIKIVVDCNGAANFITPKLLSELNCTVISLNSIGNGFYRNSEPAEENLLELRKLIKISGAQLGIAHDGDGDRTMIFDETGKMLGQDIQLAIAIEHELESVHKKGTILSTVEASILIKETIEKNHAKNIVLGVGSTNLSHAMEETNALFAGEPIGEYIFKNGVRTPDGILTAAKFLEIFAEKGTLSKLKQKYQTYPILREKIKCINKTKAMEKIKKTFSLGGKRNLIDGIREDFSNGFVLIRASGTENTIRLTAEFKDSKKLKEMTDKAREVIIKNIEKEG